MALKDISDKDSIIEAIREIDNLGREVFLAKYGYGKSKEYFLNYKNKKYDSKAIVGVAHSYQFPTEGSLLPSDFSGGYSSVQKKLESLGFEVVQEEIIDGVGDAKIVDAIEYLLDYVIEPALNSSKLSKETINSIKNTKQWIKHFRKVGDLYQYLLRFQNKKNARNNKIYQELENNDLESFETIIDSFMKQFSSELGDVTELSDFIIGETYNSWDIAIFSRRYDHQRGINPIKNNDIARAIFVKAELGGNGKYKNEWIEEDRVLKYYMYSYGGKFSPNYEENKLIINGNIPIYLFVKNNKEYVLNGIFEYDSYHGDDENALWFKLIKNTGLELRKPVLAKTKNQEFDKNIKISLSTDVGLLEDRLSRANKIPEQRIVVSKTYNRNPDVIARTLIRAKGKCEECGADAPFISKSTGEPYLEVHHIISLSDGGEDSSENAKALCPNCHRRLHFG